MRHLVVIICLLALPVAASEPGQALDCTDWVWLEPGHTCAQSDARDYAGLITEQANNLVVTGNSGDFIALKRIGIPVECPGITESEFASRYQLVRWDGVTETIIGYIDERCSDPIGGKADVLNSDYDRSRQPSSFHLNYFTFDEVNGRVYIPFKAGCAERYNSYLCTGYQGTAWLWRIDGFATSFEVFQTYTPEADEISFRVPAMPEGMGGADYFDTYWGNLASVGNWSEAHGLLCGFPAAVPEAGDYLTVQDALPAPGPGQGYYYVTATAFQGERRYGRKASGNRLTGRDPAVLPACEEGMR